MNFNVELCEFLVELGYKLDLNEVEDKDEVAIECTEESDKNVQEKEFFLGIGSELLTYRVVKPKFRAYDLDEIVYCGGQPKQKELI